MEDYILGILGIFISVFLFVVGYRQTVGAKRERIIAGNAEVEKILVRRIVLEEYTPTLADISRLLEGKARDFRVKNVDLHSESEVLNSIFTRMLETDFITQTQREKILTELLPALEDSECVPSDEQKVSELIESGQKKQPSTILTAGMGFVAAIAGAVVSILPKLGEINHNLSDLVEPVSFTMLASLLFIGIFGFTFWLRESQLATSINGNSKNLEKVIRLEREVAKVIFDSNFLTISNGSTDKGYDFLVQSGNHKILIEVKAWSQPRSSALVRRIADRIGKAVVENQANEGILVTESSIDHTEIAKMCDNVRFMTTRQLKQHLKVVSS